MCKKIFLSTLLFSNFFLFSVEDKELDLSSSKDKEKYDTIILTLKEKEVTPDSFIDEFTKKVVIAKIKGNNEEILISILKYSNIETFEDSSFGYALNLLLAGPNENLYKFDPNKVFKCLYGKKEEIYETLNKEGDTFFIQCEKTLLKEKRK